MVVDDTEQSEVPVPCYDYEMYRAFQDQQESSQQVAQDVAESESYDATTMTMTTTTTTIRPLATTAAKKNCDDTSDVMAADEVAADVSSSTMSSPTRMACTTMNTTTTVAATTATKVAKKNWCGRS